MRAERPRQPGSQLTRFDRRLGDDFLGLGLARAAAQVAAAVAGLVAAASGALRAGDHRWVRCGGNETENATRLCLAAR